MGIKQFESFVSTADRYLRYGNRCCQLEHVGPDGRNVSLVSRGRSNGCFACYCNLEPGPYTFLHENVAPRVQTKKLKYTTEEEKAAARSKASQRWNEKNKDKTEVYRKRYEGSEKSLARHRRAYHNLSEEQYQAKLAKARERYQIRKQQRLSDSAKSDL